MRRRALLFFLLVTPTVVATSSLGACKRSEQKAGENAALDASPDALAYLPARSAPDNAPAPPSVVERILFQLRPRLNECYRNALLERPDLKAEAVFTVVIGGDGHVSEATVLSEKNLDMVFTGCLTEVFKSAVFPAPADKKPTSVNVPLTFQPPLLKRDPNTESPPPPPSAASSSSR